MAGQLPSSEEEVQALLQSAVSQRASHIRKEAETISMANVRRLLESDLGLEKSALDVYKAFIKELVDEVLLSPDDAEAQEEAVTEEAPKHSKKKKKREENGSIDQTEEKYSEDSQEQDHVELPRKKKQKKEKAKKGKSKEDEDGAGSYAEASISEDEVHEETSKKKSQKSKGRKEKEEIIKEVDENGGGSQSEMSEEDSGASEGRKVKKGSSKMTSFKPVSNKKIEHLKKIIKACGLTIPPQIYKRVKQQPDDKHDKFLIKELEEMLSRRGLSSDPSEKEIKAAKRKIAREKDLEGIDTTNIIMEPRGRRAASQFFAPVYNPPPAEYDSELDEGERDEEQDEEEESDNSGDGSGDEEGEFAAADDTDNSD